MFGAGHASCFMDVIDLANRVAVARQHQRVQCTLALPSLLAYKTDSESLLFLPKTHLNVRVYLLCGCLCCYSRIALVVLGSSSSSSSSSPSSPSSYVFLCFPVLGVLFLVVGRESEVWKGKREREREREREKEPKRYRERERERERAREIILGADLHDPKEVSKSLRTRRFA